jgi:hypothetical protein
MGSDSKSLYKRICASYGRETQSFFFIKIHSHLERLIIQVVNAYDQDFFNKNLKLSNVVNELTYNFQTNAILQNFSFLSVWSTQSISVGHVNAWKYIF